MGARPPRLLARTRPRLPVNAVLSAGAFAMLAALVGMMAAVASRSAIAVISVAVIIAILGVLVFGAQNPRLPSPANAGKTGLCAGPEIRVDHVP